MMNEDKTAKAKLMKSIIEKVKTFEKKPKLVLCEAWDERGLKATNYITRNNFAEIVMLGNSDKIKEVANKLNIDISNLEIIDPETSGLAEELAIALQKKREHKGITIEKARELIKDVNYFGCMLALIGKVDGVVGSLICPTGDLMKPVLQLLRKGHVNEVAVWNDAKNNRVLFSSDSSLNISPTSEELATIGINAGNVTKMFGFEPKVGFLSFSTYGSGGNFPEIQKVKKAIEIAKEKAPDLEFDGEFQFDAALNPEAAAKKCPDSKLGGKINTLIFPDLNSANIFAHGAFQISNAEFIFTILAGLAKPVSILGRTTDQESVTNMFIATALQTR